MQIIQHTCEIGSSSTVCVYEYASTTEEFYVRNDDIPFGITIMIFLLCILIILQLNPRKNGSHRYI